MFINPCLLYRFVENYEHKEGAFVRIKFILDEASKNVNGDLNINVAQAGAAISSIWGSKVQKVRSSSCTTSGYRNISKRHVCEEDMEIIETFDEGTVNKLKLLSSKHEEWILGCNRLSNGHFS